MAKEKKKAKKTAAPTKPQNQKAYNEQKAKYDAASKTVSKAKARVKKTAARKEALKKRIKNTSGAKRKENLRDKKKLVNNRLGKRTDVLKSARKERRKYSTYKETTGGSSGKKTPTPNPFLTAEQQGAYNDSQQEYINTLNSLDAQLADAVNENRMLNVDLQRHFTKDVAGTNSNMAARGLFGSSIRDAAIADLSGSLAREQMNLQTNLETFNQDLMRQRQAATSAWEGFQSVADKQAVENSIAARKDLPEYEVEPTAGKTTSYRMKSPKMNLRAPTPKKNVRKPNKANKNVAAQRQKAKTPTGRMTQQQQPARVQHQPSRRPTTPGVNG